MTVVPAISLLSARAASRRRRRQGADRRPAGGVRQQCADPAVSDPQAAQRDRAPARNGTGLGRHETRQDFADPNPDRGEQAARDLAKALERKHPGAAASLREGLEQMFTVARLGVTATLAKTLTSSNPIESMISIARTVNRNVTHWKDGAVVMRWTAAGMTQAKASFRRIKGYAQMPALAAGSPNTSTPTGSHRPESQPDTPEPISPQRAASSPEPHKIIPDRHRSSTRLGTYSPNTPPASTPSTSIDTPGRPAPPDATVAAADHRAGRPAMIPRPWQTETLKLLFGRWPRQLLSYQELHHIPEPGYTVTRSSPRPRKPSPNHSAVFVFRAVGSTRIVPVRLCWHKRASSKPFVHCDRLFAAIAARRCRHWTPVATAQRVWFFSGVQTKRCHTGYLQRFPAYAGHSRLAAEGSRDMQRFAARFGVAAATAVAGIMLLPIAAHAASTSIGGTISTSSTWTYYTTVRYTTTLGRVSLDPSSLIDEPGGGDSYLQIKLRKGDGSGDLSGTTTWLNNYSGKNILSGNASGIGFRMAAGTWQGGTDVAWSGTLYY